MNSIYITMPYRRATRRVRPVRARRMMRRHPLRRRIARRGPTSFVVPRSKFSHQPVADRYFVWLECFNSFHLAPGTTSANYQINLSDITYPFSTTIPFPNPLQAVATQDFAGLKNFLYNSGTSTGLYLNYRCWSAIVSINTNPSNISDSIVCGMAPIVGSTDYSNITTLGQGPGSRVLVASSTNTQRGNTLVKRYSIPQLIGVSKSEYGALTSGTYGTFATGPSTNVFVQYAFNTQDNAATASTLSWTVRLKYFIEFFGRTDYQLLDG